MFRSEWTHRRDAIRRVRWESPPNAGDNPHKPGLFRGDAAQRARSGLDAKRRDTRERLPSSTTPRAAIRERETLEVTKRSRPCTVGTLCGIGDACTIHAVGSSRNDPGSRPPFVTNCALLPLRTIFAHPAGERSPATVSLFPFLVFDKRSAEKLLGGTNGIEQGYGAEADSSPSDSRNCQKKNN